MNASLDLRPRKAGATLRVWEIADEITRNTARLAKVREVKDKVVSEGGNVNTAATQYYAWKSAQENVPEYSDTFESVRLMMGVDGRILIPLNIRRAMGLSEAGAVTAQLVNGELRLFSPTQALKNAQSLVQKLVPCDVSLADELIVERRNEARK